ncbi:fibulin-2 isoform 3-T6 [Acridotheres tristis]
MARAQSWQQSPWDALLLVLLCTGSCQAQRDCTGAECQPLENCIEDVLEPGECCATCLQHGCTCEGYQYYDCVNVGFVNGKVPEGQSYFVDFGSTECSCPKGGGKISCQFMLCPELPPNCIDAVVPADGCPQCGRIGCLHEGQKYVAGHTFHMPPCKVCHCPNAGGELMCYQLPDCDTFSLNTASPGDAEDSEPERHYDDPYSYDQEASEGDNAQVESPKKYRSYSSHLEHESLSQEQGEDYDYLAASVAPSALATTDPHTQATVAPGPTQAPRGHAEPRGATERGRRLPRTTAPSLQQVTHKEMAATTGAPPQHTTATTETPQRLEELERRPKGNKERHEQERAPHSKMKKHARKEEPENSMYQGLKEVNFTEPSSARPSHESLEGNDFPKVKFSATTSPPVALKEDRSQSSPKQSQTLYRYHPEEDGDPNSIHANPRLPEGSTKELIESCCGAGQQWAIDNGECTEIPVSGMDGDICRIAQKQCCVSTVRENSCLAGMLAAKDGDTCGPEDSDPCAGSSYKQCCDCCSLGLRLRSEGKTCESNINLGYPCSHVLLSCCEGGDHFVHPEIKRHPEPLPTVTPEKVSEREDHHEALSISSEAELSNSLPGDDLDECLLYGGELCQHLCINTVGSYKCSCFPEFTLQEDGTSCSPDPDRGQVTRLEAEATIPTVASPSQPILVVSLQEEQDKCKDNGPCKHLCNIVEGDAVCSCMAGYTLMADGVSCEDVDECQTGVHRCGEGQLCHNLPGGYRCDCKMGYQYDSFSRSCIDINECWNYPGRLCQHTCENTPGSYHCSCSSGFRLSYDGKHCEDVNECDNSPCSQECANVYGSYQCYCRQGFQLGEDGHSCKDIDECTQSAGILCTFRCLNIPGSYQCACPEQGYTMAANGRTCRDIDECAIGTHNCSAAETCYNIQGSFRCLSFECPSNYRKVSDMRCERISCFNYLECQNTPVRITYYQLNFQTNIVVPAHIFRIGPSPAYAGDSIVLTITKGNEEGFFSTRRLNSYTGIVYLQRQVKEPKDFLLDVEMKLWRQGTYTTFLAKIYIFITAHAY